MDSATDATDRGSTASAATRVAAFAAWAAVAAYLAAHHVFWRDEVRAFSLALSGDGLVGMARAVHGEGHPLLWYALLRLAHDLTGVREALPAVAFAVGTAAAGLFAARAPFRPLILFAALLGLWMAFDYVVMARNYGISALLMFALADRFARRRERGWSIGALLFLLCQTNVPAVVLAGGFLLFWLVDIARGDRAARPAALRGWAIAAACAAAGALACFLTVYPPFNEAAVQAGAITPAGVAATLANVAGPFFQLWPEAASGLPGAAALLALLILAGALSLARRPPALVAALAVLPVLMLFFRYVYPGSYRHQALYLAYLVSLHWIAAARYGPAPAPRPLLRLAGAGFALLLVVQCLPTALLIGEVARGRREGQAEAVSALLRREPYRNAVVVAVPEVEVEALRWYVPNPTFLIRQRRFGAVTHFTNASNRHLTLGQTLAAMRAVRARTGRPVIALVAYPLSPAAGAEGWDEGILGDFSVRPGEAAAFLGATRLLQRPAALIGQSRFDERYWVYALR